ncbi:hypothetical protein ECANGB1_1913 [Enterospora canceri]|uniref:Uncharacterized protein n=1 Tax=Enterospora canceri TaxID=1081671 RepID=A0A1Y1S8X7_9MICR|nr:hypothetical protein ECANGB1_1913 [Enterospora canceri]
MLLQMIHTAFAAMLLPAETVRELPPPIYMHPETLFKQTKNALDFAITGSIILYPTFYLKNIKYNAVAISGIIMGLNHFGMYDTLVHRLDSVTPASWSPYFISAMIILVVTVMNMFYRRVKVLTSSLGGAYANGITLYLLLDLETKESAMGTMLGFTVLYVVLYYVARRIRKFILFGTMAGWLFYSLANVLTGGKLIGYFYQGDQESKKIGAVYLIGILSTTFMCYTVLRVLFRKKKSGKKQKKLPAVKNVKEMVI